MIHLKREIKKHIVKVLLAVAVFLILFIQIERINDWIFTQGPDGIKAFFDSLGFFSPFFFVIIYIIGNIFLIPSIPFTFTSGIVYGLTGGIILSLIGEIASATVNFCIGRKVRDKFLPHKIHNKKIRFVKSYVEKHGFSIILIFRYLGFYFDVVSYAAGATKIRYKPYLLATFIGFFPYIFLYAYTGNQLMDIKSSEFMYFILYFKIALFGAFILGYLVFTFIQKRRASKKRKVK